MRKLIAFNFVSLDGYFEGARQGDISWHQHGGEEADYSAESLEAGNTLLFGRVTYEQMVSFWPTPLAMESFPLVAKGMNRAEKVVFSKTLKKAEWNNTRLVKGDLLEEIRELKQQPGKDMTILGSGSLVTQLTDQGLIDEYQIMIDPVAIGEGTPLFKGIRQPLKLKLLETRTFGSGIVLLRYQPAAA